MRAVPIDPDSVALRGIPQAAFAWLSSTSTSRSLWMICSAVNVLPLIQEPPGEDLVFSGVQLS